MESNQVTSTASASSKSTASANLELARVYQEENRSSPGISSHFSFEVPYCAVGLHDQPSITHQGDNSHIPLPKLSNNFDNLMSNSNLAFTSLLATTSSNETVFELPPTRKIATARASRITRTFAKKGQKQSKSNDVPFVLSTECIQELDRKKLKINPTDRDEHILSNREIGCQTSPAVHKPFELYNPLLKSSFNATHEDMEILYDSHDPYVLGQMYATHWPLANTAKKRTRKDVSEEEASLLADIERKPSSSPISEFLQRGSLMERLYGNQDEHTIFDNGEKQKLIEDYYLGFRRKTYNHSKNEVVDQSTDKSPSSTSSKNYVYQNDTGSASDTLKDQNCDPSLNIYDDGCDDDDCTCEPIIPSQYVNLTTNDSVLDRTLSQSPSYNASEVPRQTRNYIDNEEKENIKPFSYSPVTLRRPGLGRINNNLSEGKKYKAHTFEVYKPPVPKTPPTASTVRLYNSTDASRFRSLSSSDSENDQVSSVSASAMQRVQAASMALFDVINMDEPVIYDSRSTKPVKEVYIPYDVVRPGKDGKNSQGRTILGQLDVKTLPTFANGDDESDSDNDGDIKYPKLPYFESETFENEH